MPIHNAITRFAYGRDEKKMLVIPREFIYVLGGDLVGAHALNRLAWWSAWAYKDMGREDGQFWKTEAEWKDKDYLERRKVHSVISVVNAKVHELWIKTYEEAPKRKMIEALPGRERLENGKALISKTTYYTIEPDQWQLFLDWAIDQEQTGGEVLAQRKPYTRKPKEDGNDKNAVSESEIIDVSQTTKMSLPNDKNAVSESTKNDVTQTAKMPFVNRTENTSESTAENTSERVALSPDVESAGTHSSPPNTDTVTENRRRDWSKFTTPKNQARSAPPESQASAPAKKSRKASSRNERVNGRFPEQQAELVEAYYRAMGVSRKDVAASTFAKTKNVLKDLPGHYTPMDVEHATRVLMERKFYADNPHALTPIKVKEELPKMAARVANGGSVRPQTEDERQRAILAKKHEDALRLERMGESS